MVCQRSILCKSWVLVWQQMTVKSHQTLNVTAAEYFIGVQGKPQVYVYNGGRLVRLKPSPKTG
jgi:hypothetical protein